MLKLTKNKKECLEYYLFISPCSDLPLEFLKDSYDNDLKKEVMYIQRSFNYGYNYIDMTEAEYKKALKGEKIFNNIFKVFKEINAKLDREELITFIGVGYDL